MCRLLAATIMAAVAVLLMPAAGMADPYKWCAVYGGRDGGGTNCGFVTLDQCRATISGIGGVCQPNPFYTGTHEKPARRGRKRNRN